MISDKELNEIEDRCLAAQPGEWKLMIEGIDHVSGSNFIMTGIGGERGDDLEIYGGEVADLVFISHTKADILRLVAEIRELRQGVMG